MQILVTGAAGKTGQAVIRALAKRQTAVRALVRRGEQVAAVRAIGADEVVVGNMLDTAVWSHITQNVTALYHICPNMHPEEVAIGRMAMAAARRNGVSRFVYHSVLHPHVEAMPHHWHKMRVEEMLLSAGLDFTILQPAAYMQNLQANWPAITGSGIYQVPYALTARMSLVDLADVAAAAVIVLTQPGHSGAIYELAGQEILDQVEIARVLSRRLGREVTAVVQPLSEWESNATKAGLSPYTVETLLQMFRYYDRYGFWANSNVLGWLLGRPPTSLWDCLKRLLDTDDHR